MVRFRFASHLSERVSKPLARTFPYSLFVFRYTNHQLPLTESNPRAAGFIDRLNGLSLLAGRGHNPTDDPHRP